MYALSRLVALICLFGWLALAAEVVIAATSSRHTLSPGLMTAAGYTILTLGAAHGALGLLRWLRGFLYEL